MGTMLYNGVELPALPDYDVSAYPYAVINRTDGGDYQLYLSPKSCVAQYNGVYHYVTASASCVGCWYILSTSGWMYVNTCNGGSSYSWGAHVFWSNHDILYNGEVFLAASDPVDPNAPTADPARRLKSLINGLLCGLVTPGRLGRTPVAYSYNGVVLPKLPEWDREKYPYAVISAVGLVSFMVSSSQRYIDDDGKYLHSAADNSWIMWRLENNEWVLHNSGTSTAGSTSGSYPTWSNYDIANADGTIYLADSEPVPVYE